MGPLNNTAGDLNRNRKLSSLKVRAIRRAYEKGQTAKMLAVKYKVHENTIRKVVQRVNWKSVD